MAPPKVIVSTKAAVQPFAILAAASYINSTVNSNAISLSYDHTEGKEAVLLADREEFVGTNKIIRFLGRTFPKSKLYANDPANAAQVDFWLDLVQDTLYTNDFKQLGPILERLNHHLKLRSFFVGYSVTLADIAVWGALRGNVIFARQVKTGKDVGEYLGRWYQFISSLPWIQDGVNDLNKSKDAGKTKKADQGSFDIDLPGAAPGKVVTRFPPEPSGYLHIGHAKAALLNEYFARLYNGKLLLRFDDTNPSKEKSEFEESIKEDLSLLEITPDQVSHTSDHFQRMYELAIDLIKSGKAYVDDTPQEQMRNERMSGTESKNRNNPVETNLQRFEEMRQATEYGLQCCLRAKIDMKAKNKALCDPVIYRCNLTPHHYTGTKWKIYPTYDFACPIVDAIEGVTHALRTTEYRDRNAQYEWFLKALNLRKVHIWEFSRINFIYTLLSKRKLTWFVNNGLVAGWDDPRFPTIRGVRRRGMTVEALRNYILMQGASQKDMLLEWDKIWSTNKKAIDPVAPRHTALDRLRIAKCQIIDKRFDPHAKELPKHKKNPDVGVKQTVFSPEIYLEWDDAKDLEVGEEVTLMDWGNAIVEKITWSLDGSSFIAMIDLKLNLEGDFRKTKKKLTWLARPPSDPRTPHDAETAPIRLTLIEYTYLINKKKLEEDDEVTDCLTPVSMFTKAAWGDGNLRHLKKGDIIQLERKGYYICDKAYDAEKPFSSVDLILIPDGKAASLSIKSDEAPASKEKAAPSKDVTPPKAASTKEVVTPNAGAKPVVAEAPKSKPMYHIPPIYGTNVQLPEPNSLPMYIIPNIYGPAEIASVESAPAAVVEPVEAPTKIKASSKEETTKEVAAAAPQGEASPITKLDIVVGHIIDVKKHPDADSLYVEQIDVGEDKPREVVSGLVKFMTEDEVRGKTILVLKNMKPAKMRGITSYAMVLCASNEDHSKVEFLVPPAGSKPGDKVYFEGYQGEPEAQLNPKKKVFETVQPDFTTRDDLVATWNGIPFRTAKGVVKAKSLKAAHIK
ncbi:tRNA synthetases class I, catalytic domain-containing protein [Polychytrium aggregatum]|uniref:tRNA synthetases class I, catalytic domain-containing protein n=1 Tax=Polychytrium aggregatum TaxID=110093 RepID=UPI0022FE4BE3|nr:tRNA synthetases class I, catalytic domain-containing protein [Polychytrium aggregatum]KAI9199226.1 tRNA synthetases class I, catalytic domain-containing protein [Polychytrium aggregatum]